MRTDLLCIVMVLGLGTLIFGLLGLICDLFSDKD